LGERVCIGLPFSADMGAAFNDDVCTRVARFQAGMNMPWGDLSNTLIIGLSMGGLLGAMLAQRQTVGSVCCLSAPDSICPEIGLTPDILLENLLAVYSSTDDLDIHGRTKKWSSLTPYDFDLEGLSHDHDANRSALVLPTVMFLAGSSPEGIWLTLKEAEGEVAPW